MFLRRGGGAVRGHGSKSDASAGGRSRGVGRRAGRVRRRGGGQGGASEGAGRHLVHPPGLAQEIVLRRNPGGLCAGGRRGARRHRPRRAANAHRSKVRARAGAGRWRAGAVAGSVAGRPHTSGAFTSGTVPLTSSSKSYTFAGSRSLALARCLCPATQALIVSSSRGLVSCGLRREKGSCVSTGERDSIPRTISRDKRLSHSPCARFCNVPHSVERVPKADLVRHESRQWHQ